MNISVKFSEFTFWTEISLLRSLNIVLATKHKKAIKELQQIVRYLEILLSLEQYENKSTGSAGGGVVVATIAASATTPPPPAEPVLLFSDYYCL